MSDDRRFAYPSEIHERLIFLRMALGYKNQRPFALELGVDTSDYSAYERGKRTVPLSLIYKLMRRYHVTSDWILTGSDAGMVWETRQTLLDHLARTSQDATG